MLKIFLFFLISLLLTSCIVYSAAMPVDLGGAIRDF